MKKFFHEKNIVITGCCGTIGRRMLAVLAEQYSPRSILGIDHNESELFFLGSVFGTKENVRCLYADIRDEQRLTDLFAGADIALHTAALKHVFPSELSPSEAIKTNILGVNNVIAAAFRNRVSHVAFTSSDKAANPTNVMGTTKLMGEKIISAAQLSQNAHAMVFTATRFGNVLGSHGSVVPIFREQILRGGPVTVTDEGMTRFVMSIDDAVNLVFHAASLAKGGEVFVTKMRSLRIVDLARAMVESLQERVPALADKKIEIEIIGCKPGEKIYEELLTEDESKRTFDAENFFVIQPAFRDLYAVQKNRLPGLPAPAVAFGYRSDMQEHMRVDEIKLFLAENDLI
jgi:FlaA1/EpsC-like NDP-sugar epimerase